MTLDHCLKLCNNFNENKNLFFKILREILSKKISIGHDNSGDKAGWHLQEVHIEFNGRKWSSVCNRWFARDEDDKKIERELTDIKVYYRIRVITSNIANAGTDADVFIELIGTIGSSG